MPVFPRVVVEPAQPPGAITWSIRDGSTLSDVAVSKTACRCLLHTTYKCTVQQPIFDISFGFKISEESSFCLSHPPHEQLWCAG